MNGQLTIDGREVASVRPPRPLTERQREVLRFIRQRGLVRPFEVGVMMHAGRRHPYGFILAKPRAKACCQYASSDGYDALRRLERRGLVRREGRGQWVPLISGEGWT